MQDDRNTVVEKAKIGSHRPQVIVAVLGLVFLCSVMALIAAQVGRSSAILEKVGTLADFLPGSVTRIQLKATFADPKPRIHAVTASDVGGKVIGVTPLP